MNTNLQPAYVLHYRNYRETSLITNIYTLRFGKITGILKGFYTLKKEFTSPMEVHSLNELTFYPKKREIWLISYADLICDYPFLRKDESKALVAAVFFNLIDKVMPLWVVNTAVFHLLRESLDFLEKEEESKVLYVFLIKFLTLSGFKPEFNHCLGCHSQLEEDVFFSASKGGLVCDNCFGEVSDARKVNKETTSSLLYIQKNEFTLIFRLNPTAKCEQEIFYILREFLFYHLGFDIAQYLEKLHQPRKFLV